MFWINADKAVPAPNKQLVKVKVADSKKRYTTYAYYNHGLQEWWSYDGYCLKSKVYAWKQAKKYVL